LLFRLLEFKMYYNQDDINSENETEGNNGELVRQKQRGKRAKQSDNKSNKKIKQSSSKKSSNKSKTSSIKKSRGKILLDVTNYYYLIFLNVILIP